MSKQPSLFTHDPQTPADISRQTPLQATFKLFKEFLHKSGKSQHTIVAFETDLRMFAEQIGGSTPIGQIQTSDLNAFLEWLEANAPRKDWTQPLPQKSYARRVTTLKVYFKWLHGLKAIPSDPAKPVLQRSGPAPLSEVLTMEQIQQAIDYTRTLKKGDEQDYRPEMLFRLLLDTGLKKSEVMNIRPQDIDRMNRNLPVLTVRHKSRNVYKERRLDLDPDWLHVYDLYLEQYPRKPGHEGIITCTARNLEYILTDIAEGIRLPFKLSFEVMRWTCAVRDYRLGMDEQSLREKLGLSEASWYETGRKVRQLAEKLAFVNHDDTQSSA
ncbi:MAG: hypothetical protein CUN56_11685 [Phototrophicales bacterium]|nr:MAG: hypothetical protein CUN56_11685 [Phototrophicales bacterium]RMG77169.1 MAG: hypothetical protein D6711_02190 [Chloroflexota bacterium]